MAANVNTLDMQDSLRFAFGFANIQNLKNSDGSAFDIQNNEYVQVIGYSMESKPDDDFERLSQS